MRSFSLTRAVSPSRPQARRSRHCDRPAIRDAFRRNLTISANHRQSCAELLSIPNRENPEMTCCERSGPAATDSSSHRISPPSALNRSTSSIGEPPHQPQMTTKTSPAPGTRLPPELRPTPGGRDRGVNATLLNNRRAQGQAVSACEIAATILVTNAERSDRHCGRRNCIISPSS